MDLLLYLVRREEVDIHDIPIARILDQFLEHIKILSHFDVDGIGDFLVMASTLMEIKSRMLLPQDPDAEEEEEDPRLDLVQKLIEYRKFKEISEELGEWRDERQKRFPRGTIGDPSEGENEPSFSIGEVSIWDLCAAYAKILKEIELHGAAEIVFDDTPIEEHMGRIVGRLDEGRAVPFRDLFPGGADRGVLVGVFLAVLELIRQARVRVFQEQDFGEILVAMRPPAAEEPLPPQPFVEGAGPEARA